MRRRDQKIYFTVTALFNAGVKTDFIKEGMPVYLEKEPDNEYDREAILVKLEGLGKIGYVANSVHTVVGESHSAGRLYDKFGKRAIGTVKYNMGKVLLCELNEGESEPNERTCGRRRDVFAALWKKTDL